jgi:hypothetical protein
MTEYFTNLIELLIEYYLGAHIHGLPFDDVACLRNASSTPTAGQAVGACADGDRIHSVAATALCRMITEGATLVNATPQIEGELFFH